MDQSIEPTEPDFGSQSEKRRNFALGVVNGVGFRLAESLIDPPVVLAWFVSQLTASNLLIGLVAPLGRALWSLPQILFSSQLQRMPRKMPVYRVSAVVRLLAWLTLAAFVWFLDDPRYVLIAFFILYSIARASSAPAGLVFYDIVAKTIPARQRGSFFAWRQLLGGLLGLAGGLTVGAVLNDPALPFPRGHATLFLMYCISLGIGLGALITVREPSGKTNPQATTVSQQIARAVDLLRTDPPYRRYTAAQISLQMSNLAQPFLVVYARKYLGAPDGMVGIYVLTRVAAFLLANLLWGHLSDQYGNRLVLQLLCLGNGLVQVLALLVIVGVAALPQMHGAWLPYMAIPAFFMSGAVMPAYVMAGTNFLLEIVDEAERPLYLGFFNTVIGGVVLISGFGGLLLAPLGFGGLFTVALALCLIAYWITRGLPEPRDGEHSLRRMPAESDL